MGNSQKWRGTERNGGHSQRESVKRGHKLERGLFLLEFPPAFISGDIPRDDPLLWMGQDE